MKLSSRRLQVTFLYSNSNMKLVDKTKHTFYPCHHNQIWPRTDKRPTHNSLQPPLTSSLLCSHNFLTTLLLHALNASFPVPQHSVLVSSQYILFCQSERPHNKQEPKLLLCIVIFVFSDSNEEEKASEQFGSRHCLNVICL